MNLHDIKYKIQDNIKYIYVWIGVLILIWVGVFATNKFLDLKKDKTPISWKVENKVNVVDVDNNKKTKPKINWTSQLKEHKASEKEIKQALWQMIGRGSSKKKEIVKEDVDLQNIKNIDLYMKQKEEIKNNITLPKNILEKFYQKMKKQFSVFLKDNIVKKEGGIKKHFINNEKKILQEEYPDYDFSKPILITWSKLNYLYEDITNYKNVTKNKCSKVFGKKVCKKETKKYLIYNWKYIDLEAVKNIKIDNKNFVYLIVKKKGLKEYTLIIPFHKRYWIYGYKFLIRYKQALKYRDYSFLYFISKNNIRNLKDVYVKNILNTYDRIFLWK